MATTESEVSSSTFGPVGAFNPLPTESSIGTGSQIGRVNTQSAGESNYVKVSGGSQSHVNNNVLASKDKSPYAVTLHNVDKFDQITEARLKKSKRDDGREEVVSSEEYMTNLRQSFDFVPIG